MNAVPGLLLRSISLLRTCARGLRLRSPSPPWIGKVLVSIMFVPLLTLLGVLLRIYTSRIGPFQADVVTAWGARWTCRLSDHIQFWIYLLGIWEPDITAFVRRRLAPGDTFVDVGAHVGYYTVLASGLVGESGRVVAVEPSPRNFGLLTANLALDNRRRNVRAVNMAAASQRGTVDIWGGLTWGSDLTTTQARRGFRLEARVPAEPLGDPHPAGGSLHPAGEDRC